MNTQEYKQENNYPKAFLATGLIMGVLLALCYFIVFHNPPQEVDGTGGILVNYGTVDEGAGTDIRSVEEPSRDEKETKTKPDKVVPPTPEQPKVTAEESDKKVVTQNNEEAPEVNDDAKKPVKNSSVVTKPTKAPPKQTVNSQALFHGMHSNGAGEGDGTGSTPGNQGSPNGSNLSTDYGKGGSGNGLKGMPSWSFNTPLNVTNNNRVPGIVVIDITVDPQGNVIEAHVDRKTRMSDLGLINKCLDIVKSSKLSSSKPASGNQTGQVNFQFNLD